MSCGQSGEVAFSNGLLSLVSIYEAKAGEVAQWLKVTVALPEGPRFYS